MTKIVKTLIIETDQYTGNIDANLCGFLFGTSDDRMNSEKNIAQHNKLISKKESRMNFLSNFLDSRPVDEYGMMLYYINNDLHNGYNSLEVYPNEYSHEHIKTVVDFLKIKFGNEIELIGYQDEKVPVKILGYHVKTEIIETEIEKL